MKNTSRGMQSFPLPFAMIAMNGKPLPQAVDALFATTKMGDAAFRKSLLEEGEAAVAASAYPMILMARRLDPLDRELLKWHEDNVQSVETTAGEKIGKARFAIYGKSSYPDATFTLRLRNRKGISDERDRGPAGHHLLR